MNGAFCIGGGDGGGYVGTELSTVLDSVGSPVSFGGAPVEVELELVVELLRAGSEVVLVLDVVV